MINNSREARVAWEQHRRNEVALHEAAVRTAAQVREVLGGQGFAPGRESMSVVLERSTSGTVTVRTYVRWTEGIVVTMVHRSGEEDREHRDADEAVRDAVRRATSFC